MIHVTESLFLIGALLVIYPGPIVLMITAVGIVERAVVALLPSPEQDVGSHMPGWFGEPTDDSEADE